MEKGLVDEVGAVIIGRNEGERFKCCLRSVKASIDKVVYVDSGSTDDSVVFAQSQGVLTTELDLSVPFSAGRARNEGFAALLKQYPELKWVQFIDGDCELEPDWLATAKHFLEQNPGHAIACGRRAEKAPRATIFNRLCDIEWDTPVGTADACGGDFMIRAEAFTIVEGFNSSVIAGEEPEMCFRLRAKGMKVERLDCLMTHHDAQLTRFGQWWSRVKRCGHAYAQGASMHGDSPERYCVSNIKSIIFWGGFVPAIAILGLILALMQGSPWWLLVSCAPLVLVAKVFRYAIGTKRLGVADALLYSGFITLGKVPELVGIVTFAVRNSRGVDLEIIEYK